MTGRSWTLRITAPAGWLSKNQRKHRVVQATDVKAWREAGWAHCKAARVPPLNEVEVTAVVRFRDDHKRRDAPNVMLAILSALDGVLLDAGVVADDNDSYVRALHILPGEPIPARPYGPAGELVLTITEVASV